MKRLIPLRRQGIGLRGPFHSYCIKHPELRRLKVGEHLDLPKGPVRPAGAKDLYVKFYKMAQNAGIRVYVRTIDEGTVRVTRKVVALSPGTSRRRSFSRIENKLR